MNSQHHQTAIKSLITEPWKSNFARAINTLIILAITISSIEHIVDTNSVFYKNLFGNNILLSFCLIIFIAEFIIRLIIYEKAENNDISENPKTIIGEFLNNIIFKWVPLPPFNLTIDFLCIISIIFSLFSHQLNLNNQLLFILNFIGIARIWKITRYFDEFGSIKKGFNRKKLEIINSLVGILLLSITISAAIYYAEPKMFGSIWDAFIWSIAKYTEDYAGITESSYILSHEGKVLATINGLLGIALFALPAGLLASAFIDEIAESKKMKELSANYRLILEYLMKPREVNYFKHKTGSNFKVTKRFATFQQLQGKFIISESDIFEAIRKHQIEKSQDITGNHLRLSHVKSDPNNRYFDLSIIVAYKTNTNYGYKDIDIHKKTTLISPAGHVERFIDHFSYSIYANTPEINYISRNIKITLTENKLDKPVGARVSKLYIAENLAKYDKSITPKMSIHNFMDDINNCVNKNEHLSIILAVSSINNEDIIYEFGNSFFNEESDTIKNEKLNKYHAVNKIFERHLKPVKENTTENQNSLSTKEVQIYRKNSESLMFNIQKTNKTDVIYIGVNIKILANNNSIYYEAMNAIRNIIVELNSL